MSHTSPSPSRPKKRKRQNGDSDSKRGERNYYYYSARDLSMTCSQCRTARTSEPWYRARRLIFAGALAKEKKDEKARGGGDGGWMCFARTHVVFSPHVGGIEGERRKTSDPSTSSPPPLRSSPSILDGRRMGPATLPFRPPPPATSAIPPSSALSGATAREKEEVGREETENFRRKGGGEGGS